MLASNETTILVDDLVSRQIIYVYARQSGGNNLYSPKITVDVYCHSSNTSVATVTSSSLQNVSPNSSLTRFELAFFTPTPSACFISNYFSSSSAGSVVAISSLQSDGTKNNSGSLAYFAPTDISIETQYRFMVHANISGTIYYQAIEHVLNVGCGDFIEITESGSFQTSTHWYLR